MRIAIIGSGISGLVAAHRLNPQHDVTVYEAAAEPGGHSHTVDVTLDGQSIAVDTGFIVFNERNYPSFTALLAGLGVASQPAEMSFSLRCDRSGLEYSGSSLNTLFAQRANLLRPRFYRMLGDILRLNRMAPDLVAAPEGESLGGFLAARGLQGAVLDDYLLPMAGAIWSARPEAILEFPARHFGRFFSNHGLLEIRNRPQWRTVTGGSRQYVRAIARPLGSRLRLHTPVEWVRRLPGGALLKAAHHEAQIYDAVVFACHSDQALALLRDPTPAEQAVLGAIPYQENEAVLHTDERLLPRRALARAAWNYHRLAAEGADEERVTVTYDLTLLQQLPGARRLLVTLNASAAIDPARVLRRITFHHPVFDARGMAAQERWREINGRDRAYFCGAYWGYGFHEDGVRSGLAVADAIEGREFDAQLHLRRVG
jgi:predicted NAD/FAD-binding protein